MIVCHITCVHPRYDVRIFEKECSTLAKNGYKVYLVVNDNLPDELINGVHIVSTGFKPSNRAERFLKSAPRCMDKALSINADIYHLHDPELLGIVKRLKKRNSKIIYDAHEDTQEQIWDKYWIPQMLKTPLYHLYGLYSKSVLKKVDGIITVTPVIVKKLKEYNSRCVLITNYPILSDQISDRGLNEETEEIIRSLGDYVFFAGGISKLWCHEIIVDAVEKVKGLKYVIAGTPDSMEYLDTLTKSGVVEYLGRIPHDKVNQYYKGAVAGIAVLKCYQTGKEGTLGNTKIFEIMQAETPVICSDQRLWREIIEECKCGISVNGENPEAIADAIRYILTHKEENTLMGKNGKWAIQNKFNWQTQTETLIGLYKEILN